MSRRLLAVAATVLVGCAIGAWLVMGRAGNTPTSTLGAPRFVEEATSAGLVHTYGGDSRFFVGGGLAAFDCDDDGRPELYLAGGAEPAALYRNRSPIGGALRFERLADPVTDVTDVTGAYPLDVDGDGHTDLAVLRAGENVMLRGLGACEFERANERWGIDGGDGRTMAFSATWEGSAPLPTLAFGDYIALDPLGVPQPPCPDNVMLRPAGDRYGAPIPLSPGYCALSMLFSDWDRSGRRDLRISNDRQYYTDGQEQLWRVEAGSAPRSYTDDDGWARMQIFGMGIASQDVTDDGYPEVYLTSQGDNKLQSLLAGPERPTYRDIALRRGVNAPRPFAGGEVLPSTAWHPEFDDVNNDGFVDLLVTKGNVSQQEGYASRDPGELLLGTTDGTFTQATDEAGLLRFDRGRGAALVDLNLDGWLDLVGVYLDAPVGLWRNTGPPDADQAHWLAVRLEQDAPNRDAIGAWIEVRIGETVLRREVTVGGGHISGELGWIHFGLGPSSSAEIRVTWPDGRAGGWQRLQADAFVILRPDAEPRYWEPAP